MTKPVAINSRIDADSYGLITEICDLTNKSVAAYVKDACLAYYALVKNPQSEPTDALKIDQFAWSLKTKGNKQK